MRNAIRNDDNLAFDQVPLVAAGDFFGDLMNTPKKYVVKISTTTSSDAATRVTIRLAGADTARDAAAFASCSGRTDAHAA